MAELGMAELHMAQLRRRVADYRAAPRQTGLLSASLGSGVGAA